MKPHVRLVEPPKEGKMKAGQTVGGNTPGRLLFLDFDGVINSERYIRSLGVTSEAEQWILFLEAPEQMIDPEALKRVRHLCSELQMKIVVSSTWRYKYNEADFINMFAHHGWHDAPIIGMTQNPNSIGCTRGHEIKLWVDQYDFGGDYFILDDMSPEYFLPEQRGVQTEYETGLLDEHIPEFIAMVNGTGEQDDDAEDAQYERWDGTPC